MKKNFLRMSKVVLSLAFYSSNVMSMESSLLKKSATLREKTFYKENEKEFLDYQQNSGRVDGTGFLKNPKVTVNEKDYMIFINSSLKEKLQSSECDKYMGKINERLKALKLSSKVSHINIILDKDDIYIQPVRKNW